MTGASLLLLFSVLQHTQGAAPAVSPTAKGEQRESGLGFHAALEAGGLALPSGAPPGELEGMDGFAVLFPRLEVYGGKEFLAVLGAPLRLRLLDQAPPQQGGDVWGVLRREDWDEQSDLGQVVQRLRIAPSESFRLEAGALYQYTLGEGHVVSRYNNQLLPDYHPAGAQLSASLGAARVDLFASDVLATRLFAGQVRLDLGRLTGGSGKEEKKEAKPEATPAPAPEATPAPAPEATPAPAPEATPAPAPEATPAPTVEATAAPAPQSAAAPAQEARPEGAERYLATLAVAYDLGRGGGSTPALGAANLGAHTALYKQTGLELWAMINGGVRLGQSPLEAGGAFGLRVVAGGERWQLRGRLEGRYQGGGFRFGLFGAGYELARFAGVGLSAPPLAEERLPMSPSGAGEVALELGSTSKVDGLRLHVSLAGEYFAFGRVDADLAAELVLPGGNTTGSLRVILTGLQVDPRYAATLQVRQRLAPWLFAWGSGGVVHFAQAGGGLVRGYTGGLGMGVDFEG